MMTYTNFSAEALITGLNDHASGEQRLITDRLRQKENNSFTAGFSGDLHST